MSDSSLCNLCVLCVSVVVRFYEKNHHRDTEVAQRRVGKSFEAIQK